MTLRSASASRTVDGNSNNNHSSSSCLVVDDPIGTCRRPRRGGAGGPSSSSMDTVPAAVSRALNGCSAQAPAYHTILPSELEIGSILGEGEFGKVYQVRVGCLLTD